MKVIINRLSVDERKELLMAVDQFGDNALHLAVGGGDKYAVRGILEATPIALLGTLLDTKDRAGKTLLNRVLETIDKHKAKGYGYSQYVDIQESLNAAALRVKAVATAAAPAQASTAAQRPSGEAAAASAVSLAAVAAAGPAVGVGLSRASASSSSSSRSSAELRQQKEAAEAAILDKAADKAVEVAGRNGGLKNAKATCGENAAEVIKDTIKANLKDGKQADAAIQALTGLGLNKVQASGCVNEARTHIAEATRLAQPQRGGRS